MDPVAPLPLSAPPPSRVPLRTGNRDDAPGAFWSQPEPPKQELGFGDLLDALNPLQHLPIVGMVYRELTGDIPHPAARVIGGAIFGGASGMFSGVLNAIVEQETGKDLAQLALGLVIDGAGGAPAAPAVAAEPSAAGEATPDETTARIPAPASPAIAEMQPIEEAPETAVAPAAGNPAAPPSPAPSRRPAPGTRDLAYYQAMRGTRLPAAAGTTTTPPIQSSNAQLPLRPALAVARATTEPAAPAVDFSDSMRRGLDLYQRMKRDEFAGHAVDVVE